MRLKNNKSIKSYALKGVHGFALNLYFFSIHFESWDPFFSGIDYLFTKITIVFYILISFIVDNRFVFPRKHKNITYPLILIFVIQTLAGFFYQRPGYDDYFSTPFFLSVVVFLAIIDHEGKDTGAIKSGLYSFVWGGILLSLFYLFGIETDNSWHNRVTIFGINQNMLAVNLAIVLLLMIHKLLFEKNIKIILKSVYIVFIPLIISFMASTGSRSGFVTLLGGVAVMYAFKRTKSLIGKVPILFFGLISSFLLFQYFFNNSVIGERIENAINSGDLSGRDDYWKEIPKLIDINPFFGIGTNGYAFETYKIYGYYASAHNVFVEVLIMGGIISLILLLIAYFRIFRRAYKKYAITSNTLYISLLIPLIVMAAVGHPFGTKITWGIFAFLIVLNDKNNSEH